MCERWEFRDPDDDWIMGMTGGRRRIGKKGGRWSENGFSYLEWWNENKLNIDICWNFGGWKLMSKAVLEYVDGLGEGKAKYQDM